MTDSRDSSVSRDVSGGGGGGGGEEDGGLLSVTAGLAEEAANLFQSRKYSECIDILHQLLQKKKDDPKVLHNVVVAEYYRDGCSDPKRVLELLNKVKKRSEELARASGEQVGALSNHGSAMSGSKGSGTTLHQHSASNTSIAYIDEYDTSVATLNIAVVLFHLHEHASALLILDQLFRNRNIERIDETVALHMCLLLLDVALASHDATTAADVLQYVDKAFGYMIGQADTGTSSHPQYSHPPVKTSSAPTNSTSLDITTSDTTSENPLVRTYSDEHYETFLSRLDTGDQNLAIPPNDMSKPPPDPSLPSSDLKLKLYLYKVRLLILTRNLKAAKRELKNIMEFARDSPTALLLKSQLEYTRGNYRKAIKLLTTANSRTESGMPSIFNNDLGCIYHQLNKHNSSNVLFLKALKSTPEKPLLTMYNCGLEYLICGKPVIAARCFQKAGLVFYNRPLLWLRIAECCISALHKGMLLEEVKVHVAGKGKWRQVVVEEEEEEKEEKNVSISIPFARQCLLNALHLLNSFESKSFSENGDTNTTKDSNLTAGIESSVRLFKEIQKSENNVIKQAVLANLAYVELTLSNPLKALTSARLLLRLPECSRRYVFLARMYLAEALCRLNRAKEAVEYLSVYMSDGINVEAPYGEENVEEAVGALHVNIAAMFALRGDFDQAERYAAKGVELLPENHQAVLTAVYVDLLMGKTQEAIVRLKECNRVRFVPTMIG